MDELIFNAGDRVILNGITTRKLRMEPEYENPDLRDGMIGTVIRHNPRNPMNILVKFDNFSEGHNGEGASPRMKDCWWVPPRILIPADKDSMESFLKAEGERKRREVEEAILKSYKQFEARQEAKKERVASSGLCVHHIPVPAEEWETATSTFTSGTLYTIRATPRNDSSTSICGSTTHAQF